MSCILLHASEVDTLQLQRAGIQPRDSAVERGNDVGTRLPPVYSRIDVLT